MNSRFFHFTLYAIIVYLACTTFNLAVAAPTPSEENQTHFCGFDDCQLDNRRYARVRANLNGDVGADLNVGEPRTVRMIYFLPNDWPYRADVVQKMKDTIRTVQTFYAEQMDAHGYEDTTLRFETDPHGEPMVHRVDGQNPFSHYDNTLGYAVLDEIERAFDLDANIYFIVLGTDALRQGNGQPVSGVGDRRTKNGGMLFVANEFSWGLVAHELGHTFGLGHDFRNGAYIMSYGPGQYRLSICSAEFLSVHSYFNPDTPIEEREPPTIELISSRTYPPGSQSVPVRLKVNPSEGLHQVRLSGSKGLVACRGLAGEKDAVVEFDYDGDFKPRGGFTSLSDRTVHLIHAQVIDTGGNGSNVFFNLLPETLQSLTKISGDNQPPSFPNVPLPVPFVVEVRDVNYGSARQGVWVTFTVTGGGGTLSAERVMTDLTGRAESTLTLGPSLGRNTVEVSAAGSTVTFTAVAERTTVNIPDPNLRAALEKFLNKGPGTPITPAEMASLTETERGAWGVGISDLTGLEFATNLTHLYLSYNSISDISAVSGLTKLTELRLASNSISDISAVSGLTKLTDLSLAYNSISDISAVSGLTNLTRLELGGNSISDISAVSGLTKLTDLSLAYNSISDISAVSGLTNLTRLELAYNSISDISAVSGLTNLIWLRLRNNSISDISAVSGLTNLRRLWLENNSISDISAVAGLTKLTELNLGGNNISDISALAGLTKLKSPEIQGSTSDFPALSLGNNRISDLSPLVANTGLGEGDIVDVRGNPLSYQSINTHIPTLQSRGVDVNFNDRTPTSLVKTSGGNQKGSRSAPLPNPFVVEVRDKYRSAFEGVPVTFTVTAGGGTLSTQSTTTDANGRAESTLTLGPDAGTNTVTVTVAGLEPEIFTAIEEAVPQTLTKSSGDEQRGLAGAQLANPFIVEVRDQNSETFAGAIVTFTVTTGGGMLSTTSTTTDKNGRTESTLTLGQQPGTNTVTVTVSGLEPEIFTARGEIEFDLSVPAGISLIHVPLKVTAVDGVPKTIESVGDLYDALGGAATVSLLITYDPKTQRWNSYIGPQHKDKPANKALTDDLGIIASMKAPGAIRLSGDALGTNGRSSITLHPGINLVGVPLRDSRIARVSELLNLEGIRGNVSVIIVSDDGFKVVTQAGDDGDIPIMGGGSFILTAREAATVPISGTGWYNRLGPTAASPMVLRGIEVGDTTPVLAVSGSIGSPVGGASLPRPSGSGFRVTVKNLSTGKVDTAVTDDNGVGYQFTFVDTETGRAAQIGDILEISAQSSDPFVGVQPLRYVVTPVDVKRSHIQLAELVAYEIPSETELLLNYPNPFNPETWIPYRLAADAFVRLTIYDLSGGVVRRLDVGLMIAAVYESRSKAVYWDGRNQFGERVASGIYFYTLTAGDYSATRKMVILK